MAQAQSPFLDDPSDYGWQRTDQINTSLSDEHRDQICDLETALDGFELAERFGAIKADLADTALHDLTLGEAFFHVECVYETGLATPLQLTGINHLRGRDYTILDALLERYPKSLFRRKFLSYGSFLEQVTGVSVSNLVPQGFDLQQLASSPRPRGFYTQEALERRAAASLKAYYGKRAPDVLRSRLHQRLIVWVDMIPEYQLYSTQAFSDIETRISSMPEDDQEYYLDGSICGLKRKVSKESFLEEWTLLHAELRETALSEVTLGQAIIAVPCEHRGHTLTVLGIMAARGFRSNNGIEERLRFLIEQYPFLLIRKSPIMDISFYNQMVVRRQRAGRDSIGEFLRGVLTLIDSSVGHKAASIPR